MLRRGFVRTASAALCLLLASGALASSALGYDNPGPRTPTAVENASSGQPPPPHRVPDSVDKAWPADPPWDACPRPVWSGEKSAGGPGNGRRVLIIGDSLTRESRTQMAKQLRKSGWTPTFRCWGSKRLDWGLDQISRAKSLGQLPAWVIVALGTNDISWETTYTTTSRTERLLDRLGRKRQVLWVDLHLTRSTWLNARADWFNAMVRDKAERRSNVKVIGWHSVARKAGIRGWDGIHYGPSGYRLRAITLVDALNARARAVDPPMLAASASGGLASPSPTPGVS